MKRTPSYSTGGSQLPLLILLALVALLAGLWLAVQMAPREEPLQTRAATVLNPPKPLPEFALVDGNGQPFTRAALAGKWSVLFFGYTLCPDVCPTALGVLTLVAREVSAGQVNYVFVSVDPERDTPAQLKTYTSYFNPAFIGATAPLDEMGPLLSSLGVVHRKVPGAAGGDYLVDHTAALYVVNPAGELAAVISPPHDPQAIISDLRLMQEKL